MCICKSKKGQSHPNSGRNEGYGNQFRYESMQHLVKAGMLEHGTWQECKEKGIKVLDNLKTGCKKSEVKAFVNN
jgi:hypothetical protein